MMSVLTKPKFEIKGVYNSVALYKKKIDAQDTYKKNAKANRQT